MRRRGTPGIVALLLAAGAATGVAACTKVGTDPNVPVAIELVGPPLPSLVVGDTMRDFSGQVAPIRASVFNSNNEPIPDAPIHFLALDSLGRVALDTSTGIVVGRDTGEVKIVAHVGNLQSEPATLTVVEPPTAITTEDPLLDTLHYTIDFVTGADTLRNMFVRLVHVAGTDTVAVPQYLVEYLFEYPAGYDNGDSTRVQLVSRGSNGALPLDSARAALFDTTGVDGATDVALRITPLATPDTDSVIVRARAAQPGGPVEPVRFVVHYTIEVPQ